MPPLNSKLQLFLLSQINLLLNFVSVLHLGHLMRTSLFSVALLQSTSMQVLHFRQEVNAFPGVFKERDRLILFKSASFELLCLGAPFL